MPYKNVEFTLIAKEEDLINDGFKECDETIDYFGGAYEWKENYIVDDLVDATNYGQKLIKDYNNTLNKNKGEIAREFIRAEECGSVLSDEIKLPHEWGKTNLITIIDSRGIYDKVQCKHCGVTGKRYGIGGRIIIDAKYKANKYIYCNRKKESK